MTIEEIISEIKHLGTLSAKAIDEIEEDSDLRLQAVQYFQSNKDRNFALEFLRLLSELRRSPNAAISGDTLMLACYILGKHEQIPDCMKIWECKRIDFDTFSYIDIQLVVFLGVQCTIDYLETQTSEEARAALEYINTCHVSGDFHDLEQYYNEIPWFI